MTSTLPPPPLTAADATPRERRLFAQGEPQLRADLKAYKESESLSNAQLGVKLGVHATYVSKYLSGTNDFDAGKVDRVVGDLLKAESLRTKDAVELFESFVTRRIAGDVETVRKTGDFGLIFSDAGLGKTSGMQLIQRAHPLALALTASKNSCSVTAIQWKIFGLLENKSWNGRTPVWDFIVDHLKGSNRPVMIDNMQRLGKGGLQYLFDLQDETGVPIIGFGNPEIMKVIRGVDQMFSRIGLKDEIALPLFRDAKKHERTNVEAVVDGILERMIPAWRAKVRDLALQVAWQKGHFRALRKHLTLAHQLALNGGALEDPCTAFQAAHTKLVSDYALETNE